MNKKTKAWLIIATLLILTGSIIFGGVMSVLNWDFTKLSTVKYETNSYEIKEEFKNITVITKTANIEFMPSEGDAATVVCYEEEKEKHNVEVKDDSLIVEINDTKKWYEHIGVSFNSPKITLYIPQKEYGEVCLKASTGNIGLENMDAESFDVSVSTGSITLADVDCGGDVRVKVSTGKADLSNIKCNSLISDGSTGVITLKNVIAEERFDIERSTGNIKLENCDAGELNIKTNTGSIKGSLLSDKVFEAETDTGDIDVPKTRVGGKCKLSTDTGNIKIEILSDVEKVR